MQRLDWGKGQQSPVDPFLFLIHIFIFLPTKKYETTTRTAAVGEFVVRFL
jgi:hypothetical protein